MGAAGDEDRGMARGIMGGMAMGAAGGAALGAGYGVLASHRAKGIGPKANQAAQKAVDQVSGANVKRIAKIEHVQQTIGSSLADDLRPIGQAKRRGTNNRSTPLWQSWPDHYSRLDDLNFGTAGGTQMNLNRYTYGPHGRGYRVANPRTREVPGTQAELGPLGRLFSWGTGRT